MSQADKTVFLDPSYEAYYQNKLFSDDPVLGRNATLATTIRLKESLAKKGINLMTADYLFNDPQLFEGGDYCSLGILHDFSKFQFKYSVKLIFFVIFEPPIVRPDLYAALPDLTKYFEVVFVHNTHGDGYSLKDVDQSKLAKLYWPQPYHDVLEQYWSVSDRQNKVVVINGNHKPASRHGELYSKRIEAMCALSNYDAVDLFGMNWEKWWARSSWWIPYFKHRSQLMKIYHGPIESKFETLSHYRFALCFENMMMDGYMTEKLFDCFYAGTVPLYLGAPDVEKYIPKEVFVDCRQFQDWKGLWDYCNSLSSDEIEQIKQAGKQFLQSKDFDKYYYFLENNIKLSDATQSAY